MSEKRSTEERVNSFLEELEAISQKHGIWINESNFKGSFDLVDKNNNKLATIDLEPDKEDTNYLI